ncbi:hypothetical protein LG651_00555 [Tamlana sp. 62-3]|uniref:Peptidoglycan peptidase n=1 Tax=Neotamlana sargassicola TaxID=2883125 RepID=A0A9X1L352_9FLAO|nr:YiiX/YebB-like N1pC/P60 family cysteine hydrolase [Tamlana sargassicola]MCB4806722.1 hypothetical protein [Tamlana sargassicola]
MKSAILKKLKPFAHFILTTLLVNCSSSPLQIQTGDIVFRSVTNAELSEAINEVTQTAKKSNYTHIGVCEVLNNMVYVYHSDSDTGVVKETIEEFYTSEKNDYSVDLFRIKNIDNNQLQQALKKAKELVGKPYNFTYILEDEGYYCSEYIYEVFKNDSVFTLEPMTFKNPKTKTFHEGWVNHYNNLGIPIPEDKLGCNPNGMANSNRLQFIATIN